jgi:hypothetical protein
MATTTNYGWTTPDNTAYVKDGASAIRSLGSAIDTTLGTGLLAWTAYTPTLTSFTAGTGGTVTGRYSKIGKLVNGYVNVTLGTGFTLTDIAISLPLAKQATGTIVQSVWTLTSAGAGDYTAINRHETGNITALYIMNASGTYVGPSFVSTTIPFTWKATDSIRVAFTYECA